MNNGTRSYDKFDIDIFVNFRDASGMLLISEEGFIDAETLRPGQSSAFDIFLLDEELPETVSTYDLIVNDERVVIGQPLEGNGGGNNSGSDNDDDNNSNPLEDVEGGSDQDQGNGDGNNSADNRGDNDEDSESDD